jgi:hypothetical protein
LRTLLNFIWLILSGIQAIADRLNADRVPTAQGGQEWYPSTVRAVATQV